MNGFILSSKLIALLMFLFLLWILWIKTHQLETIALLAELKRRFRAWVTQVHGKEALKIIEQKLRNQAGKDPIKQKAVDIVIDEEKERIIQKFGSKYVNEVYGPPGPLERDF